MVGRQTMSNRARCSPRAVVRPAGGRIAGRRSTVVGVTSADGPRDPFLDDPNDPSAVLAELDDPAAPVVAEVLGEADRDGIVADLEALDEFRRVLAPQGLRGLVVECDDCGELHYFSWELMTANLRALLGEGRNHVHEPAYSPDAADYVSWDYARGYVDAVDALAQH